MHRSYKGRMVDMDALARQHENTIAAGNMSVNARGDKIGPGGKVVEKAETLARKHHRTTTTDVEETSLKPKADSLPFAERKQAPKKKPSKKESKVKNEIELDNGDIIIDDGEDD